MFRFPKELEKHFTPKTKPKLNFATSTIIADNINLPETKKRILISTNELLIKKLLITW